MHTTILSHLQYNCCSPASTSKHKLQPFLSCVCVWMSIAKEFAQVLQSGDPLEWVNQFKAIIAREAFRYGEAQLEDPSYKQSFENFDLETKLWDLASIIYEFRVSGANVEELPTFPFSSAAVKQHNFLLKHKKTKELALIINWIQENSNKTDIPVELENTVKWDKTRSKLQVQKLNVLSSDQLDQVLEMDEDCPLRTGKQVDLQDRKTDEQVFEIIYQLVLESRFDEAVQLATSSGNFTLALILIGAANDYVDPVVDKNLFKNDSILESESSSDDIKNKAPMGQKHKNLWRQTVYDLSQKVTNPKEKLIYNYLCGGDITENIKVSQNWEQTLLLYLHQLYSYQMCALLDIEESLSNVRIPPPQAATLESILNFISNSNSISAQQSANPIRIISGSIMIDKIADLVHNESTSNIDGQLLRITTHLAIFVSSLNNEGDKIANQDLTRIIGKYIDFLCRNHLEDLIPIYLTFIPNEADARELYSEFLVSLVDPDSRKRQLEISRKLYESDDRDAVNSNENYEGKLVNVLRRTVEKVMIDTAKFFEPKSETPLILADGDVDPQDKKLNRSVDWLFENNMYEDAIAASITTIRRFLLCGKLNSLKEFGSQKNFVQLIKDYDFQLNTKLLSSNTANSSVSEDDKEELQQYAHFISGLIHIDNWKSFLKENKINGVSVGTENFWQSTYVKTAIEKVTTSLSDIIYNWFKRLISCSTNKELFMELRAIYVPYLVMELIQIYQYSRFNDWAYVKSAFNLFNSIANDENYDLLHCFIKSGRIQELAHRSGEFAAVATEKGIAGVFAN